VRERRKRGEVTVEKKEESGKRDKGRMAGKRRKTGTHIGWAKCLFGCNGDASSLSGLR
jgi:hypothetical protein